MPQKFEINGLTQTAAATTLTGSTAVALTGNCAKSDWLLVQNLNTVATSPLNIKLGGASVSVTTDGPLVHPGTNGIIIKRNKATHFAVVSVTTTTVYITPVTPL